MMRKVFITAFVILMAMFTACQVQSPMEEKVIADTEMFSPGEMLKATIESGGMESRCSVPTIYRFLTTDCTLSVIGNPSDIPMAGSYTGMFGILRYFYAYNMAIWVKNVEIQEVLVEGDRQNVHAVIQGYVYSTGNTFSIEYIFALTTARNRISTIDVYYDTNIFHKAFTEGHGQFYSDLRNPTQPVYDPFDTTDYRPIVQAGLDDFYVTGDAPSFLSKLHPGVYWVFKGDEDNTPYARVYSGANGVLEFLMNIAPNSVPLSIEFTDSIQQGNRLDYFFTEHLYAVPTGEDVVINGVFTFLMKDNLMLEFKTYHDTYAVSEAFQPD